jgi:fumarylacetoacetase
VIRPADETNDAGLRSWVSAANDPAADFPIQNLPFGVFRRRGVRTPGAIGVAIGDRVLDLSACTRVGLLAPALALAARAADETLNGIMTAGREAMREMRRALVEVLEHGNAAAARRSGDITLAFAEVELLVPARIGDYSDFYASVHHATNVGSMFRPDSPLLPNYKYIPIGYHGRASSIAASGSRVHRPWGQTRDDPSTPPRFGPTRRLDYELEIGAFIGVGNAPGERIELARAEEHLFGISLVNDWSARDIQTWEYQPLGPFLAKSFATSVSPWVVTMDALAPFRGPAFPRGSDDPPTLPYLSDSDNDRLGGLELTLEVWLRSERMRERGLASMLVSRSGFADMYWTLGQLITHHSSNGCNLRPGDLLASGTVSGSTAESRGCLLERAWRGTEPLELPTGERRTFLEDGDEVILRGFAERESYRRIGLGECAGVVSSPTG